MAGLGRLYTVDSIGERDIAIEGLRAYAALIVFFVHFSWDFSYHTLGVDLNHLRAAQLASDQQALFPLLWLFSGHYGVDLFFLISGYLIAGMVKASHFRYAKFMVHRVLRIYPVLIVSTLIYVGYLKLNGMQSFTLYEFAGNLLLLNGIPLLNFPDINLPTWSIFFEFAFYILFPLIWKLSGQHLGRTWLLAALVLLPLACLDDQFIRFFMFMAGVTLKLAPPHLIKKITYRIGEIGTILLYIASTTWFFFDRNYLIFIPIYMLTAGLLLEHAVHGRGVLFKLFTLKPLRYFGNISFSFYLFQILSIMIARPIVNQLGLDSILLYFICHMVLSLGISSALATATFIVLEKPYFRYKVRFDQFICGLKIMPKPPSETPKAVPPPQTRSEVQ
jgi:exopolysaccharide production protein ExoZ